MAKVTKLRQLIFLLLAFFATGQSYSQTYPQFGPEIKVAIARLTFDAMEPFISPDGNTLFFNSLNAGGNTNLYYATRVSDSAFNYMGMVGGTYDPSPGHLDAVASLDSLNNFFWTFLRGYPASMENLHRGVYSGGSVSAITRVYGDFNRYLFNYPFGWLIMDASINLKGNLLYYCNAKFDFSNTSCAGVPCESGIGIAQKTNDSTFHKLSGYDTILENINDTLNYLVYAPQVSNDGFELYYTRLQKNTVNTEICVSVRKSIDGIFSPPMVIRSNPGYFPEAVTISADMQKIYYHQKDNSGLYRIFLRYRKSAAGYDEPPVKGELAVYPNPANTMFTVVLPFPGEPYRISVFTASGQEIYETATNTSVNVSDFAPGISILSVNQHDRTWRTSIVIK